ncbi:hypothetical protein TNCV_1943161 [Trichonephila clavipes]|nr:hypothetical protein TNCV_1943161 [Trichonephila clavipes]
MSTMSQGNHLTDSEAWRVVGSGTVFWRLKVQAEAQNKVVDGQQRPMNFVFSANGSETPKYERYSSPTTPSLGYWYHGFNSDYPKPAPWCRPVCTPTAVMC